MKSTHHNAAQKVLNYAPLCLLAVIALCFAGCASTPHVDTSLLTVVPPAQLGPVSCVLNTGSRDKPSYVSNTTQEMDAGAQSSIGTVGILPLLIGTAIAKGSAAGGGQDELDKMSLATGASERQMIMGEVEKAMQGAGYDVQPSATATFTINIINYGLYKNSKELAHTTVVGIGLLKDASGEKKWEGTILGTSSVELPLSAYSANPQLYKQNLEVAAQNFASGLIHYAQNGSYFGQQASIMVR